MIGRKFLFYEIPYFGMEHNKEKTLKILSHHWWWPHSKNTQTGGAQVDDLEIATGSRKISRRVWSKITANSPLSFSNWKFILIVFSFADESFNNYHESGFLNYISKKDYQSPCVTDYCYTIKLSRILLDII